MSKHLMLRKLVVLLPISLLVGCRTYVAIPVLCEPPADIVVACQAPDQSYVDTVLNSQDPNIREAALVALIGDIKKKLEECSAKQAGLSDLLGKCNKIADRTANAISDAIEEKK